MARVLLDLNTPRFLDDWFGLEKPQALAVLATLRKLHGLTWPQLYSDKGLKWELVHSKTGVHRRRLYSMRITKRMRALALGEGDYLCLVSLHPEHDSAYQ
jgi:hypothetical protein